MDKRCMTIERHNVNGEVDTPPSCFFQILQRKIHNAVFSVVGFHRKAVTTTDWVCLVGSDTQQGVSRDTGRLHSFSQHSFISLFQLLPAPRGPAVDLEGNMPGQAPDFKSNAPPLASGAAFRVLAVGKTVMGLELQSSPSVAPVVSD